MLLRASGFLLALIAAFLSSPQVRAAESAGAQIHEGVASYYGGKFHGRRTASGEKFDKHRHSAASNHFPLGTWLAVRRSENGPCTVLRVNDRMSLRQHGRIVDVSKSAATHLGMLRAGISRVQVAVLPTALSRHGQADASDDCHAAFAAPVRLALDDDFNRLPATAAGVATASAPAVTENAAELSADISAKTQASENMPATLGVAP